MRLIVALILLVSGERLAAAGNPIVLTTGWEQRWGDSPRDASGRFIWLDASSEGWSPPGDSLTNYKKGSGHYLWLRTTLPAAEARDPSLLLANFSELVEVYVDGKKQYSFGDMDVPKPKMLGWPWRVVPLPSSYGLKTLHLRFFSHAPFIGMLESPILGDSNELTQLFLRQHMGQMFAGTVMLYVGVICLFFYRRRHDLNDLIFYGLMSANIGMFLIAFSRVGFLFYDNAILWITIDRVCVFMNPVFFLLFSEFAIKRRLSRLGLVLVAAAALFAAFSLVMFAIDAVYVDLLLRPFQTLHLVVMAYIVVSNVMNAARGDVDARIFVASCVVSAAGAIRDTIMSSYSHILGESHEIAHWAVLLGITGLSLIIIRRVVKMHTDLALYSGELKHLNSHLSELVEERTGELAEALTQVTGEKYKIQDLNSG